MHEGRRHTSHAWRVSAALGAVCVVLLVTACARHSATAPAPPDETPALERALAASGFASANLYPAGTMILGPPGPPGDARAYAFRHVEHRKDAGLSWQISEPDAGGRPLRAEAYMCWYVKTDFFLFVTDLYGAPVAIGKPRPNEDADRSYVFRRDSARSPWRLDSLTIGESLSDDKIACPTCHTELVSVRVIAPGLDTLLARHLHPFTGAPRIALGTPLHIVASSKQPGDAMFVDNGGEWTRLDATGPSTFAGDVMPHAGFTHLAVQAMTDSSLVAVGEHFSQFTWIMEYEGIPATPH